MQIGSTISGCEVIGIKMIIHGRNYPNKKIKAELLVRSKRGCMYTGFLNQDGRANIDKGFNFAKSEYSPSVKEGLSEFDGRVEAMRVASQILKEDASSTVGEVDKMIDSLRALKRELSNRDKMSAKQSSYTLENSTDRQRGKARENLNWQCMEVEKKRIDVARLFKGSCCDVSTETRVFTPSGFHEFQY